jgi:hypothetical protein
MSETETVSGTVTQLLHPGDEQHYAVPPHLADQLQNGYSIAVIKTGKAQFPNNIPGIWMIALFIQPLLKDASQWAKRVLLENPEFDEGDEVTVTVAEQVVSKDIETALVATTNGGDSDE